MWEVGDSDSLPLAVAFVPFCAAADPLYCGAGPHILTVASSDTDAIIAGYLGFQVTQLTVRVWPTRVTTGSSRRWCQI